MSRMPPALRALAAKPMVWLVLQALVLFGWLALSPSFKARNYVDTRTYVSLMQAETLKDQLSHIRTPGYPLFLAAVEATAGNLDRAAEAQTLVYLLSVIGFGLAAALYLGSGWKAVAAATPLLYTRLLAEFSTALLTEVLAGALAIGTLAVLLVLVERPRSRWAWAGMTVLLFSTYLVRPAHLFMLALVPLLGWLLTVMRRGWATWIEALRVPFAGLCLVAVAPFLLWCSLRWVAAGHFGLVSFGGTNAIGITASMLSPEVIAELPPEHRDLATGMLERRRELGLKTDGTYRWKRWWRDYNNNVFKAGLKMARKRYNPEEPQPFHFHVEINRRFSALSWQLIRLRPKLYARWVWDSMVYSMRGIAVVPSIKQTGLLVGATLPIWIAALAWRRRKQRGQPPPAREAEVPPRADRPAVPGSVGLTVLAVAFAAASMLLIVLVEDPFARYRMSAEVFLPSAALALLVDLWRSTFLGRP